MGGEWGIVENRVGKNPRSRGADHPAVETARVADERNVGLIVICNAETIVAEWLLVGSVTRAYVPPGQRAGSHDAEGRRRGGNYRLSSNFSIR